VDPAKNVRAILKIDRGNAERLSRLVPIELGGAKRRRHGKAVTTAFAER